MALVICHGIKGGAGVTFVASQLAMMLSEAGREVTLMSHAPRDTMPFHFGLHPSTILPSLDASGDDSVSAGGVSLRKYGKASEDPDLIPALEDLGYLQDGSDKVMVIDMPSYEFAFARRLMPHSNANLCVLNAATDSLALLPQILSEVNVGSLARTNFIINALDETRRLSRHSAAFIRELTGNRLLGRIRFDEAVPEAIAMMKPLERYAPASVALADVRDIARALLPMLGSPEVGDATSGSSQDGTSTSTNIASSSSRAA